MDYLIGLWNRFDQMPDTGKLFCAGVLVVCIFFLVTFWPKKHQPPGTGQEPE